MSAAALTLSLFNSARISTLETQIASNNKRVNHLVNITSLHEQLFKAVDCKINDVSDKLALMLRINKVHFAKLTDFMEQKLAKRSPFLKGSSTPPTTTGSLQEHYTTKYYWKSLNT